MRTGSSLAAIGFALILTGVPQTGRSWGFDAHRFVVTRALALLPDAIRPFYEKHRVFVVEHSIDPDLWRLAGFADEAPRHFLNIDAYGGYPFSELPRDYDEAVRKYGHAMLQKNGLLPWRAEEMFGRLVEAFARQSKGTAPFVLTDIQFFSAVLAHYLADAHVPFHAVVNYDGQLTGQRGIHARFETELFGQYTQALTVRATRAGLTGSVRDFVFDALIEGARLAEPVLAADRAALGGRDLYDQVYFDRFFARVQPIVERRLAESAGAVAGAIVVAWERGGKPDLPLNPPRPARKARQSPP